MANSGPNDVSATRTLLSSMQTTLDACAETDTFSSGVYLSLSNSLKALNDGRELTVLEGRVIQYIDMVIFNPHVASVWGANLCPFDLTLISKVLQKGKDLNKSDYWWEELMTCYLDMSCEMSSSVFPKARMRRQFFIEFLELCDCDLHPHIVKAIQSSKICPACKLQSTDEECADPANLFPSGLQPDKHMTNYTFFRRLLRESPQLMSALFSCSNNASHDYDKEWASHFAQQKATSCDWRTKSFSDACRDMGFRRSQRNKRTREEARADHQSSSSFSSTPLHSFSSTAYSCERCTLRRMTGRFDGQRHG